MLAKGDERSEEPWIPAVGDSRKTSAPSRAFLGKIRRARSSPELRLTLLREAHGLRPLTLSTGASPPNPFASPTMEPLRTFVYPWPMHLRLPPRNLRPLRFHPRIALIFRPPGDFLFREKPCPTSPNLPPESGSPKIAAALANLTQNLRAHADPGQPHPATAPPLKTLPNLTQRIHLLPP